MDYMGLFPGYTRDLPRFSALAEAVLRQVTDLMAAVEDISSGFSVEHVEGAQLDVLGYSFAVSRKYGWTDETYRGVILRKLKRNTWDGTNETSFRYLEEGETMNDNGDGSVAVHAPGLPMPVAELLPVPLGIKVLEV